MKFKRLINGLLGDSGICNVTTLPQMFDYVIYGLSLQEYLAEIPFFRFQGNFGIEGTPGAPGICGIAPPVAFPVAHEPRTSVACRIA